MKTGLFCLNGLSSQICSSAPPVCSFKDFSIYVDGLSIDVDNGVALLLDEVASDLGSFLKKECKERCAIIIFSSLT